MRILLHAHDGDILVDFLESDEEDHEESGKAHGPVRRFIERKFLHLKEKWNTSESWFIRKLRELWHWLHRNTFPDESALTRLRTTSGVEIVFSPPLSEDDAQRVWRQYLAARQKRHAWWLGFNAVIAPFTVLLGPLPGPNLIGYWFAYRTVLHTMILVGLRKTRRGKVPTAFSPCGTAVCGDVTPQVSVGAR